MLLQYQQAKTRRGVIDINDVLGKSLYLLEHDHEFADAVRWRFRHVLLDEAQDLNPVQHRIVSVLCQGAGDLFIVGDPAQAIYGFNGADPALLVDVEQRFPGVEIIRLPSNHRCTPQVVEFGRHVLAQSGQPVDVVSTRPDGPSVSMHVAADEQAEAERVASLIAGLDPSQVRHNGVAVLARTNSQLRRIAETLQQHTVPLRQRADAPGTPLAAAVQRATRLGAASVLRAWAHDILDAPEPDDSPTTEAERMLAMAIVDFLREQPQGNGAALRAWLVATDPFGNHRESGVELLTFHAAKGREWPTVIVTGAETSLVPHRSATTIAAAAEEARLLYVAATRATHQLVLTRAERRSGYAWRMSPLVELFEFGPTPVVPPPDELRARRAERTAHERRVAEALIDWRARAARRAAIDPEHLCTIDQLRAIARERPRTAEDLVDVTGLGRMTALALIDEIVAALDDADADAEHVTSTGAG